MSTLKQNQSAQPLLFMLVDALDHITGKTGLTPTVTLSKNGNAFASPAGAVTEIGNGWYKVAGNIVDTGTLGPLVLHATDPAADPLDALFEVVAYDPLDSIRLGLSALNAGNVVIAESIVQAANKIQMRTADSWTIPINGLGNITARTKLWFAINEPGDADDDADVFIEETAGLTRVLGEAHLTAADGSIVVNDATLGDITVSIEESITAELSGTTSWAVKELNGSGDAITLAMGRFVITKPGIEAIT